jgi:hypothetical protein
MSSLGNKIRVVGPLFRIVDNPIRELYCTAWQKLHKGFIYATTENEHFTLCRLLTNVLTDAHINYNDWENRLAWIGVLGDFNDGDL